MICKESNKVERLDFVGVVGEVAQSDGGSWYDRLSDWHDDHYTFEVSAELSKGVQIAVGLKNGAFVNANLVSQTLWEGGFGNKGGYSRSYKEKHFANMSKGKALDLGGAWYVGANYNWNIENGKRVSQTISVGILGIIGGDYTWGEQGSKVFFGINGSAKVAFLWGISGSVKQGYTWEW